MKSEFDMKCVLILRLKETLSENMRNSKSKYVYLFWWCDCITDVFFLLCACWMHCIFLKVLLTFLNPVRGLLVAIWKIHGGILKINTEGTSCSLSKQQPETWNKFTLFHPGLPAPLCSSTMCYALPFSAQKQIFLHCSSVRLALEHIFTKKYLKKNIWIRSY